MILTNHHKASNGNSSPPSAAYTHQWIKATLVQIMVVAYLAPSHYLNQCWVIVNWTLRNKLQWNFNQNTKFFIHENLSENVVCQNGGHFVQGGDELSNYSLANIDFSIKPDSCNVYVCCKQTITFNCNTEEKNMHKNIKQDFLWKYQELKPINKSQLNELIDNHFQLVHQSWW